MRCDSKHRIATCAHEQNYQENVFSLLNPDVGCQNVSGSFYNV